MIAYFGTVCDVTRRRRMRAALILLLLFGVGRSNGEKN